MNGWNAGMGAGGWVVMALFWVLLLAVIVWAATRLFPIRASGPTKSHEPERPEEMLDRRLAGGEIDVDTYDRLRARLGGQTPGRR